MRNRATRLTVLSWCGSVLFSTAVAAGPNGSPGADLGPTPVQWALGALAFLAAAAALWVWLLRRQVREQTRHLRERLECETALEQRYREIFEDASDMIFTHDLEGRFTSLNPAVCRALGYSAEELKQLTIDQVLAPEYRDHGRQLRETKLAAGEVVTCQGAFIAKDGRRVMIETSLRMTLKDGKPAAVHGIARDITERKRAEEALKESEIRYRQLVDKTDMGFVVVDHKGIVQEANEPYMHLIGAEKMEEIIGHSVIEWTAPETRDSNTAAVALCSRQGYIKDFETIYLHRDGTRVHIIINATVRETPVGKCLISFCRNITERKRIEERYRTIIGTALDGFWLADMQGRFLDVNDAYCNLIGYSREELLSMSIPDIEAAEKPEETAARIRKIMEVGGDRFETHHRCKDGRIVDIGVSVNYLKAEERMSVFLRDITERKRAEEALNESEERFRRLFMASPDAIMLIDPSDPSGCWPIVDCNDVACQMNSYTREELIGKSIDILNISVGTPDERAAYLDRVRREGVIRLETFHRHRDGHIFPIEVSTSIVIFKGRELILGIDRDITERKKTEDALHESQTLYHSLVEQLPINIYRKDNEGRFIYVNPRFCQLQGKTAEELLGKTVFDLLPKNVAEQITKEDEMIRETGQTVEHEEERQDLGEKTLYFHAVKSPVSGSDGKIIGTQGMFHDVTARKQAEAGLAEASALLEALLGNCSDVIYFKDRQSRFVRYSKAFEKLFNVADVASLRGKTDFDFFAEEHARPAYEDEQEIIRTGRPLVGKLEKETHADGRVTWCLTTKMPWRDKDGNIIGTFGISKDMTAIKEAEDKLAYEQELFWTLLDSVPDAIYFKDRESRLVRVSKSKAEKTLEIARSRYRAAHGADAAGEMPSCLTGVKQFTEYLRGKTDFDFFSEERARSAYEDEQEIIRTGQPIFSKLEYTALPDGKDYWVLSTKMPWRDKDGNIIGTFGISKDVTVIKEAEDKLAHKQELLRTLLENSPDLIYFKDRESRFMHFSKALCDHFRITDSELLIGKSDFDFFAEAHARSAYEDEQEIIRTGKPIIGKLEEETHPDGRITWCLTTKMPWRDKDGNIIGTFGLSKDFTALKKTEAELEAAHKRLIETSRLAGMAEVATDVLHNVGNVLNSVNVSCSLAIDRVKASRAASLSKVSVMLEENRGRLGEFLASDPRGQQIPGYLAALAEHFTGEQSSLLQELEQLLKHIDHIKQIVAMQQSYAKVAGVLEVVNASHLVEDALHINEAALVRHTVQVRREFEETPPITTDKHKVLQILVNLIRNAKYALDESGRPDRLMTLKVGTDGNGCVKIQVVDNGVGIPQENLTRIFAHGFTTRRNGHGFGLHSSALAVRELGGSIQAQSEGTGKGANFTLLLPRNPPTQTT
jgi:PAS domain S-box-containing protein